MRRVIYTLFIISILLSLVLVVPAGAAPSRADRGPWAPGMALAVNDTVTYGGCTYRVLQAHTSLAGWEPPTTQALFTQVSCGTNPTATRTRTSTPGTGPTATRTRTATPGTGPTATRTRTATTGPTATRTNTPVSGAGCTGIPQYVAGTTYTAGQNVQNIGNRYSCTVPGWCSSSSAWAYAPGTGSAWTSAWALVGSCSGSGGSTPTPGPTANPGTKMFAPYIDVSPGSGAPIMQLANNGSGNKHYHLAFILGYGCAASWFGAFQLNTAEAAAIGTRINELKAVGGNVIIAFGGAAAPELANVCPTVSALQTQYQAVVNMYRPYAIDLDIEDFNPTAIDLRNKALKGVTGTRIHYTLGVLPTGFTQAQMDVLNNARANGTRVDLVNIMAMDYYQNTTNMGQAAISAAQAARSWLNNNGFASTQLGITPMIGTNDSHETFTLANASTLVSWANSNSVTLLAFWSLGRDNGGCPNGTVSPSCSGISQSNFQFSSIFRGFAP